MRNELARKDEREVLSAEREAKTQNSAKPVTQNSIEPLIQNSGLRTFRRRRGLLQRRSRLEIPLCHAVEADLFEQGSTHASE